MAKNFDGLTQAEQDALENDDLKDDETKAEEEAAQKKADEDVAAKKAEEDTKKADEEAKKKEDEEGKSDDEDAAKKAEEEAAAKKAEEDAAAAKAAEDEAVKNAAETPDESDVIDFVPQAINLPVMSADQLKKLDDDLKEKVDSFGEELKGLKEEYEAGDMTSVDYMDKRDAIKEKIFEAKQEVRDRKSSNDTNLATNKAVTESNWQGAQQAFFKKNPGFKEGILFDTFSRHVNAALKSDMADIELLISCKKAVVEDLKKSGIVVPGLTDKTPEADDKTSAEEKEKAEKLAAAKKKNAGKADDTKNLADVDTSESNETEAWMDQLDKMDAPEREEALEKMSKKQRDMYLGIA